MPIVRHLCRSTTLCVCCRVITKKLISNASRALVMHIREHHDARVANKFKE